MIEKPILFNRVGRHLFTEHVNKIRDDLKITEIFANGKDIEIDKSLLGIIASETMRI